MEIMKADEIRTAMRASPFQPFRLCLVDGEKIRVREPGQIIVAAEFDYLIVDVLGEGFALIDLPQVKAIEFLRKGRRPKAPKRTRGKR